MTDSPFSKHPIFQKLTSSQESAFLGTWLDDRAWQADNDRMSKLLSGVANRSAKEIIVMLSTCKFLLEEYAYPELTLPDELDRSLFALAMAQAWLVAGIPIEGKNPGLISALAILLPSEYSLDFSDTETPACLITASYRLKTKPPRSRIPVPSSERFELIPELRKLKQVYPAPRRLFIDIGSSGSEVFEVYTSSNAVFKTKADPRKRAINALIEAGLIDPNLTLANKLSIFTLDKLVPYAKKVGVEFPPRLKGEVIAEIIAHARPEAIEQVVQEWLTAPLYDRSRTDRYRVCVGYRKALEAFLRTEYDRLESYLFTVIWNRIEAQPVIKQCAERSKQAVLGRPGDGFNDSNLRFEYRKKSSEFFFPDGWEKLDRNEKEIVARYWDASCDQALEKAIADVRDRVPLSEVQAAIIAIFCQRGVFDAYRVEISDETFEAHWRVVLENFIIEKMRKHNYYRRSSREINCPGCGVKFIEWSVPLVDAVRVQMNVQFCAKCYHYIFGHRYMANNSRSAKLSDEEVISQLFRLAEALETIPLTKTMQGNALPSHPSEKQIAVGKALLVMPSYSIYVERFGSWLAALSHAGVLDDGYRPSSRGIQCLATDGHVCLSLGEKVIDDWLTSHGIPHEKEVLYPYDIDFNVSGRARADWTVGETYIEYAGLMDDPEYARKMKRKACLSERKGFKLIVLEPVDLEKLEKRLNELLSPIA